MNTPKQIIRALRVIFPNADFYRDVIVSVNRGIATVVKTPRLLELGELDAAIAALPEQFVITSQKTEIVLSRLTDAEYDLLTTSTVISIRRAVDMARSTGIISNAHPAFAPFVAEVDALGIISADRWTDLLAP
jgi:hypothetical protein